MTSVCLRKAKSVVSGSGARYRIHFASRNQPVVCREPNRMALTAKLNASPATERLNKSTGTFQACHSAIYHPLASDENVLLLIQATQTHAATNKGIKGWTTNASLMRILNTRGEK